MNWSLVKGACVAMTLGCFASPQAGAIQVYGGANPTVLDGGMVTKVVVVRRGGAYHGGVYRGPHGGVYRHGGVYHGGVYHGGAYGYRGRAYGYRAGAYGGWARPGWYGWPAGGAIAAGAALGFVGAAAAASWAGAPPAPGLCWYYTDPGQRQGFWDACP